MAPRAPKDLLQETQDLIKAKDLLAAKEVASLLGVSERTVRHWIQIGELPGFKIGTKLWRVKGRDLVKYISAKQGAGRLGRW